MSEAHSAQNERSLVMPSARSVDILSTESGRHSFGRKGKRESGKVGKWESGKVGKWESGELAMKPCLRMPFVAAPSRMVAIVWRMCNRLGAIIRGLLGGA
jgi:hypothetical protein